jgi:hypothetical protein
VSFSAEQTLSASAADVEDSAATTQGASSSLQVAEEAKDSAQHLRRQKEKHSAHSVKLASMPNVEDAADTAHPDVSAGDFLLKIAQDYSTSRGDNSHVKAYSSGELRGDHPAASGLSALAEAAASLATEFLRPESSPSDIQRPGTTSETGPTETDTVVPRPKRGRPPTLSHVNFHELSPPVPKSHTTIAQALALAASDSQRRQRKKSQAMQVGSGLYLVDRKV